MRNKVQPIKRASERFFAITLLYFALVGCVGLPPVYLGVGESSYRVLSGDTLYSIAFRHGLDYRSLAHINGIAPPYTIYPNQILRLRGSAKQVKKDRGPSASRSVPVSTLKVVKANLPASVAIWRWPLKGKVIAHFSLKNPVNKGIDILGKAGDAVNAAADGVVVYAGGNLRGYGKLVIIKHTDNFLSAYGNNASLAVVEGDEVKAGRTIASVGPTKENKEMLHFEIRRDGKPVDPLLYLPPS